MAAVTVNAKSLSYDRSVWLIGLCFVFSGATGLIYEVLWARMLGLVFGATTLAVSTVLAAFMGGLAIGSAVAGRVGPGIKSPLRAYGLIEIAIGFYALLVPFLFRWVDNLYALIWQQFHPGFFAFSLWRFVLSISLLLIPTALMGATLPVLAAALLRLSGFKSRSVTRLYTCNLFGAIFGTLIAGFVLLPSLGVRATIYIAAFINVVIGIGAIALDRAQSLVPTMSVDEQRAETKHVQNIDEGSERFWLFCAFVSGFVTISTQVAWTRLLAMIIGSSTYAFSIVVALFLIGLSLGAYVIGVRDYRINVRKMMLAAQGLTAIGLFLSLFVVARIPVLLVQAGLRLHLSSWIGLLTLQIVSAALLILLPAFVMGTVMPLVLLWAAGDSEGSVRRVGRSYAVNTVGAIAGAFLSGFILIPKATTRFTVLFAASLCVVVAGIAYKPGSDAGDPALKRALASGVVFAVILLFAVVGPALGVPSLNLDALSIGAYDSLVRVLAKTRETVEVTNDDQAEHRLLMYEEGPTSTVTVRKDWASTSMAINGRTNGSDIGDMPTQVMLGQLPILFAPELNRALVVGFATGVTAGAILQSPVQSVECVELEPATIKASTYFEHVNNRPLNDPRLHLIIEDARSYLRVTPLRYDMIASEPSHPWVPGVANLFTKEFFELGRDRLTDTGVFVQWIQIYQLSTESLRSALGTFSQVFPHVTMFRVGGASKGKDLLLIGSRQPVTFDRVADRISDPRISAELGRVQMSSEENIRSWFVCDESQLKPAVAGAVTNTDDNMHIETTVPKEAFRPLMQSNATWIETLVKK
jgi:spermidine synthase